MSERAVVAQNSVPNWYVGRKPNLGFVGDERITGAYLGSRANIAINSVFVTDDLRQIVFRDPEGSFLVKENICAHRGALIFDTPGVQSVPVRCGVHLWTYDNKGIAIGMPGLRCGEHGTPALRDAPFGEWRGHLLGFPRRLLADLDGIGNFIGIPDHLFRADDYIPCPTERMRVFPLPYPRAVMAINYLDGYHVPYAHPTFAAVVDTDTYEWSVTSPDKPVAGSMQVVRARNMAEVRRRMELLRGAIERDRGNAGQPVTNDDTGWPNLYLWAREHVPHRDMPVNPEIFAVWLLINPFVMMEAYVGGSFLAVSHLLTDDDDASGVRNTNPVHFFIHKSVPSKFIRDASEMFIASYARTAAEDDALCLRLYDGHRRAGERASPGWEHPHLEAPGYRHYEAWARQRLGW